MRKLIFHYASFLPPYSWLSSDILQLHYIVTPCYVCVLAEAALCSPNFKLITTLLARRTRLAIFTLCFIFPVFSRLFFFFSLPFPLPCPSVFPRCFSRSVSPLLCCANIIKLSRLYYTATLHFYFLTPSVILNLHAFKYSPVSFLFRRLVSHLYAASRWDVAKLCNFIANRDFHFPPCLPRFINFPAFLDRALSASCFSYTDHFIIVLL